MSVFRSPSQEYSTKSVKAFFRERERERGKRGVREGGKNRERERENGYLKNLKIGKWPGLYKGRLQRQENKQTLCWVVFPCPHLVSKRTEALFLNKGRCISHFLPLGLLSAASGPAHPASGCILTELLGTTAHHLYMRC